MDVAGLARGGNGLWMSQIGRNLSDSSEGILRGKRYLIHDRPPSVLLGYIKKAPHPTINSSFDR